MSAAGADVSGSIGREGLVRVSIHGAYANGQLNGNPDRGSGMGHLQEYRAAVVGKRHGNRANRTSGKLSLIKGLIFAVVALFAVSVFSSASHAQSGPFAGMAGNWSGAGNVSLRRRID